MSYLVKEMKLSEILDTAFSLLQNHFWKMISLCGVVLAPFYLLYIVGTAWGAWWVQNNPYWYVETPASVFFLIFLLAALFFLAVYVVEAALVKAVGDIFLGRLPDAKACYGSVLPRIGPLLWSASLAGIFVFLGFLVLVIPGIVLHLMFFILVPVVMLEPLSGMEALKRSKGLMKGEMLKALGLILIMVVVSWGVDFALGFIRIPMLQALLGSIFQFLLIVFTNIAGVVFYFQVKAAKEDFNEEQLSKAVIGG